MGAVVTAFEMAIGRQATQMGQSLTSTGTRLIEKAQESSLRTIERTVDTGQRLLEKPLEPPVAPRI